MRWPWQRRSKRIEKADAELLRAEADYRRATSEREESRRLTLTLRRQAADRLELQLRATYHQPGGEGSS